MNKFLTWIIKLFRDERGAVGDNDPAEETPDDDNKGDQDKDTEDENLDPDDELFIDLDEKEDEEDEEAKKKADEAKAKKSEEETKKLRSENETLKEKEKQWKRDTYEARKIREKQAGLDTNKDEKPLNDGQLAKLLGDASNEGDANVQLNVLKYLADRVSKGNVKDAVNAAEMSRKADDFTKQLTERFPDIADPTSDMRADIDKTKEMLGIVDHPYGDIFATGFRLFEDMDTLTDAAFESGKEEALKGTADEKRKQEIKEKALPPSKTPGYKKTHGLNASQLETATQMGLTQDQLPAYSKLVGKKPRIVSVEA